MGFQMSTFRSTSGYTIDEQLPAHAVLQILDALQLYRNSAPTQCSRRQGIFESAVNNWKRGNCSVCIGPYHAGWVWVGLEGPPGEYFM